LGRPIYRGSYDSSARDEQPQRDGRNTPPRTQHSGLPERCRKCHWRVNQFLDTPGLVLPPSQNRSGRGAMLRLSGPVALLPVALRNPHGQIPKLLRPTSEFFATSARVLRRRAAHTTARSFHSARCLNRLLAVPRPGRLLSSRSDSRRMSSGTNRWPSMSFRWRGMGHGTPSGRARPFRDQRGARSR
jgi:hypothetical protein